MGGWGWGSKSGGEGGGEGGGEVKVDSILKLHRPIHPWESARAHIFTHPAEHTHTHTRTYRIPNFRRHVPQLCSEVRDLHLPWWGVVAWYGGVGWGVAGDINIRVHFALVFHLLCIQYE